MVNFLLRYPYCVPTSLASAFGLIIPVSTVLFMLHNSNLSISWENIVGLHQVHYDLAIVWTAPFILGVFGGIVGRTSMQLKNKIETLAYQTTRLNTILDTAASAIITIDTHAAILSVNRSTEHIFGYAAQEMIGQNINSLIPSKIADQDQNFIQRDLKHLTSELLGKLIEIQTCRKNGDVFSAMMRINPMNIDEELFFCLVIDDISETKALQAQLSQAQKLEAVGQLASGVAHEINTPIQYIGDNLSALADNFADIIAYHHDLTDLSDNEFKAQRQAVADQYDLNYILEDSPKAIRQAQDGVDRVSEIVRAMKTFSHIEASIKKQTIDLHEAIHNTLTITRSSYKYIAEIETDFAPDLGTIECYPNELNQVFLNLVINAIHAIEEKHAGMGKIRITTRKLGHTIEILIQDNGIGIPKAIQEKVFNLFFTTKPAGKGTGQGLSLAHSIVVEKHRGKLFFESSEGIGTTFYIQLPISRDPQE